MLFALSLMPLTSAAEQLPPPGSEPVTEAQAVQKSVRITGTVVDAKGAPVVGATVIETGTQQGTVTGSDGKFVMNVQPSNKIQVSYVGYVTQTLAIGATTSFNVVLKEDAAMLDVYTNHSNFVCVVSNGTAVLGLGDIGAPAAMPVMEGKALLFIHPASGH